MDKLPSNRELKRKIEALIDIINTLPCIAAAEVDEEYRYTYQCPVGHVNTTTWPEWEAGKRCPDCANTKERNS